MRKTGLLVLVLIAATLAVGFACEGNAGTLAPSSLQQRADTLVVPAKSKCKLKVVCDYFAPANSCKHPPCCKKWHLEKVCAPKDSGQGSKSKGTKGSPWLTRLS